MIDTHAHIYSDQYRKDRSSMIENAFSAGVEKIFMPNIDERSIKGMIELEEKYPGKCFSMMGLHPCSVSKNYEKQMALIESHLERRKFVAIGEIGLDYYWSMDLVAEQEIVLIRQLHLAEKYKLPIVVNCRNSTTETIKILENEAVNGLTGIFHCFSGSLEEAEKIISLGFKLGIGGVVTYKNGGLDKVIPYVELKHLVLETDCPYLPPVPHRGERNEPAFLSFIAKKIAELKNVDVEEVTKVTTGNALELFKA